MNQMQSAMVGHSLACQPPYVGYGQQAVQPQGYGVAPAGSAAPNIWIAQPQSQQMAPVAPAPAGDFGLGAPQTAAASPWAVSSTHAASSSASAGPPAGPSPPPAGAPKAFNWPAYACDDFSSMPGPPPARF